MGQTPQNQAGQYSRSNPQYSKASAKRMGKGPKIAIAALCVVVLLFAGGGTAFAMYKN
jgi:cell division protein FtsL